MRTLTGNVHVKFHLNHEPVSFLSFFRVPKTTNSNPIGQIFLKKLRSASLSCKPGEIPKHKRVVDCVGPKSSDKTINRRNKCTGMSTADQLTCQGM